MRSNVARVPPTISQVAFFQSRDAAGNRSIDHVAALGADLLGHRATDSGTHRAHVHDAACPRRTPARKPSGPSETPSSAFESVTITKKSHLRPRPPPWVSLPTSSHNRPTTVPSSGSDGFLAGVRQGKCVVDMSTVSPAVSRAVAEKVRAKGGDMVDAPVSGSVATLEAGKLSGAWAALGHIRIASSRSSTMSGPRSLTSATTGWHSRSRLPTISSSP